jgi:hypothetical protein
MADGQAPPGREVALGSDLQVTADNSSYVKHCLQCERRFEPFRRDQVYCSHRCANNAGSQRFRARCGGPRRREQEPQIILLDVDVYFEAVRRATLLGSESP